MKDFVNFDGTFVVQSTLDSYTKSLFSLHQSHYSLIHNLLERDNPNMLARLSKMLLYAEHSHCGPGHPHRQDHASEQ